MILDRNLAVHVSSDLKVTGMLTRTSLSIQGQGQDLAFITKAKDSCLPDVKAKAKDNVGLLEDFCTNSVFRHSLHCFMQSK